MLPLLLTSSIIFSLTNTIANESLSPITYWSNETILSSFVDTSYCNIERRSQLTKDEFISQYWEQKPVVFRRDVIETQGFQQACDKQNLLNKYGNHEIILSSANSFSYDKTRVSLRHYVENIMSQPQSLELNGANTFYHFGDNDYVQFKELFDQYHVPFELPGTPSWGLAAGSTEVPFHTHGGVFAEVIYGKKRWFVYPPGEMPIIFDPNESTLQWLMKTYGRLTPELKPLECVLEPNEVLYLPSEWWHSTLNIGQSVFISIFL